MVMQPVRILLFLMPNATKDLLAVRPIGNPISTWGLVGMFDSKDLVAKSSELIKSTKLKFTVRWHTPFSL